MLIFDKVMDKNKLGPFLFMHYVYRAADIAVAVLINTIACGGISS